MARVRGGYPARRSHLSDHLPGTEPEACARCGDTIAPATRVKATPDGYAHARCTSENID